MYMDLGYLALIDQDFDQAREKAVGVTVAYDFSKRVIPGLSAYITIASGWDAINPATKATAPNQTEYDVTVDYRPRWRKGLWLRVRADVLRGSPARLPGARDPQLGDPAAMNRSHGEEADVVPGAAGGSRVGAGTFHKVAVPSGARSTGRPRMRRSVVR